MLEFVVKLSYIILMFSFLLIPVITLRKMKALKIKYINIKFVISTILICAILSIFSPFWKNYSSEILLRSYNAYEYNPDSGNEQVEYENVKSENIERVKQLEKTIMGIGWPLKAIFIFTFSILPVFLLTLAATEIIEKRISRKMKIIENENIEI